MSARARAHPDGGRGAEHAERGVVVHAAGRRDELVQAQQLVRELPLHAPPDGQAAVLLRGSVQENILQSCFWRMGTRPPIL